MITNAAHYPIHAFQIFKEGKKATYEKATRRSLHVVSVLWVDGYAVSCPTFPS